MAETKAGWYAKQEFDTKFLTLMSMKSYNPNFMNTRLEVNVKILRNVDQIRNFTSFATREKIHCLLKRGESFLRIQNEAKGFRFQMMGLDGFPLWFASFS
jgi:hypothetical protein